jgi:DNA invertase Pin-like site-specific DNA recombinase
MKEAVVYCRVGSKEQLSDYREKAVGYVRTNTSDPAKVEKQIQEICQYANDKGFEIVQWYIDEAVSGLEKEPPAYKKMCKEVKAKVIIVTHLDRISRDRLLLATRRVSLAGKGFSIHSTESGE